MSDRYNNYTNPIMVPNKLRPEIFHRRDLTEVRQYARLEFNSPDAEDQETMAIETHERIMAVGERMSKWAYEFYGSVEYWWVIAWYNKKPTDSHIQLGEVVSIPKDLEYAIYIATRET
jgi:hypothetical protein